MVNLQRADERYARMLADVDSERAEVVALCERIGFGNVMIIASREWIKRDPVGAFTVGPCNNRGKSA